MSKISEHWWMALLGVGVLLITILLMTADFHSIDEVAMFVTAVNVADEGEFHTNQIGYSLWGIRPGEEVTMQDALGNSFTKKSPFMVFLMVPLVILGRALPFLTISRAVLWLGPLLVTTIALVQYQLGRKLSYSRVVSTTAVLLLVAGTMMLPYAQTVFGEIFAAVGMLLTIWALLRLMQGSQRWAAAGAGTGIGIACGVNPVYFILAIIIALLILLWLKPEYPRNTILKQLLLYSIPIVIAALILLFYNYLRFGSIWETGYGFRPEGEGFRTPLWWGALGLTISPARGLLWYSPPVILAIFSWPLFYRRQPRLSWAILLIVIFHIVAFGLWWSWWGGYGWGPRFLLPTVPLLIVAALPGIAQAERGSWPWRAAILALLILGIAVQIAGTTINPNRYEKQLDEEHPAPMDEPLRYHHNPALVFDIAASPIVHHWRTIGSGSAPWQLGWWMDKDDDRLEMVDEISKRSVPTDAIVLLDQTLEDQFLQATGLPPVFGLPINVDEDDTQARLLWERALGEAERIWLVTWYPPANSANWYERLLRQNWASEDEMWIDERRVVLFSRPQPNLAVNEADVLFGPIDLVSYGLATSKDRLGIELTWVAGDPVDADYIMFVHLLNQDERIIIQQDRHPLGGYLPTSQWQPGERITDRLSFTLPDGTDPGELSLRIGWYTWPEPIRLPVTIGGTSSSGELEIVEDSLVLKRLIDAGK